MEKYKKNFNLEEKEIADEVADEILTVEDNRDRNLFFLILIFLICLIFLVASLSFAILNTYYNGDSTNVIDVGTDVVVNKKRNIKPVDAGTVLMSFNEGSSNIYMTNVLPMHDDLGKKLSGTKEYFDFNVSSTLKNTSSNIVYEISLIPIEGNTLSPNDVRVYLTEDDKEVSVNKNMVNNFSDLPDSSYNSGGKVIYRKTVSQSSVNEYVFRMWYSFDAKVSDTHKTFGCKVAINAHEA